MGLDYDVITHNSYIELVFKGTFNYTDLLEMIPDFLTLAKENQQTNIFLNFSLLENNELSNFEKFNLANKASKLFPVEYKLGVLGHKENINKFAETVARNRMMQMFVSHNRKEILDWLDS